MIRTDSFVSFYNKKQFTNLAQQFSQIAKEFDYECHTILT